MKVTESIKTLIDNMPVEELLTVLFCLEVEQGSNVWNVIRKRFVSGGKIFNKEITQDMRKLFSHKEASYNICYMYRVLDKKQKGIR